MAIVAIRMDKPGWQYPLRLPIQCLTHPQKLPPIRLLFIQSSMVGIMTPFFNPKSALQHPLWWIMLILLVSNDFIFKYSQAFPNLISGKLSDFAGLMVFPLFVALLFPRIGRKTWIAIHMATAALFAAIKLLPPVASLYIAGLNAVGLQGQVFFDKTDLIALPILLVSCYVYPRLRPVFSAPKQKNIFAAAAIVLAAVFCTASGSATPPRTLTNFDGNLMISDLSLINATENNVLVQVEQLNSHIAVDCDKPIYAELFQNDQFSSIGTWTQKPGEATSLLPYASRPQNKFCFVVKLTIDNIESVLVAWDTRKLSPQNVPIQFERPITPETLIPNAIAIHKNKTNYYLLSKGDFTLTYWRKDLFAVDYWKM